MPATDSSSAGWHAALPDWLRLQQTPGLGALRARVLLKALGSPAAIFGARPADFGDAVPGSVALALTRPLASGQASDLAAQAARLRAWLAQPGNSVLALDHPAYPPYLWHIDDAPLLLFVRGRLALLSAPALAVVGSRNCSVQGAANAEHFATALSQAGLAIVSGLALGIDAAAHRGGLRGPGSTIAVLGTGADITYPPRNTGLASAIAADGCIVSEYWLGTPVTPGNFPRRNRIISGLSRGVLVVEAAPRSGSLITARMAGEQGRDVFAIPGSIHATLSKGCHQLIRAGAKLVESAADVLTELHLPCVAPSDDAPGADGAAGVLTRRLARLLRALGDDPVGVDALAQRCKLDAAAAIGALLVLEMDGLVERLPGGLFQRTRPA